MKKETTLFIILVLSFLVLLLFSEQIFALSSTSILSEDFQEQATSEYFLVQAENITPLNITINNTNITLPDLNETNITIPEFNESNITLPEFNETNITNQNISNESIVVNMIAPEDLSVIKKTFIFANNVLVASKSSEEPDKIQYYIQDHLGSNIEVLDNGSLEQENTYYAFGETSSLGESNNSYKYTGKELDSETGLYYYGARYYSPELGRFVQADALAGSLDDPLSLNRYAYVKNNPLNYIDPTGNVVELDDSVLRKMQEDEGFKKSIENLQKTSQYKRIDKDKNYLWKISVVSSRDAEIKAEQKKVSKEWQEQAGSIGGITGKIAPEEIKNQNQEDGTSYTHGDYTKIVDFVPKEPKFKKETVSEVVFSGRLFHESEIADIDRLNPSRTISQIEYEQKAWDYQAVMLNQLKDSTGDFFGTSKSYLTEGKDGSVKNGGIIQQYIVRAEVKRDFLKGRK